MLFSVDFAHKSCIFAALVPIDHKLPYIELPLPLMLFSSSSSQLTSVLQFRCIHICELHVRQRRKYMQRIRRFLPDKFVRVLRRCWCVIRLRLSVLYTHTSPLSVCVRIRSCLKYSIFLVLISLRDVVIDVRVGGPYDSHAGSEKSDGEQENGLRFSWLVPISN